MPEPFSCLFLHFNLHSSVQSMFSILPIVSQKCKHSLCFAIICYCSYYCSPSNTYFLPCGIYTRSQRYSDNAYHGNVTYWTMILFLFFSYKNNRLTILQLAFIRLSEHIAVWKLVLSGIRINFCYFAHWFFVQRTYISHKPPPTVPRSPGSWFFEF